MAYICSGRAVNAVERGEGSEFGPEAEDEVTTGDGARVERGASAQPTLDELAQKLSELRQHLQQVLSGLDRAAAGAQIVDSRADESRLHCHACSRTGSTDEAGWTLRLCGDDELHPFCPDCDGRHVDRDS